MQIYQKKLKVEKQGDFIVVLIRKIIAIVDCLPQWVAARCGGHRFGSTLPIKGVARPIEHRKVCPTQAQRPKKMECVVAFLQVEIGSSRYKLFTHYYLKLSTATHSY